MKDVNVLRSVIRRIVNEEKRRVKGVDPNDPKEGDETYKTIVETAAMLMKNLAGAGMMPKNVKSPFTPEGTFYVKEVVDGHTMYIKEQEGPNENIEWSTVIETSDDPCDVVDELLEDAVIDKGMSENNYDVGHGVNVRATPFGYVTVRNYGLDDTGYRINHRNVGP